VAGNAIAERADDALERLVAFSCKGRGRWGEQMAAIFTSPCQGRGALLAELRAGLVLALASRTFHCEPGLLSGLSVRLT
jgi:hypothetical protein